MLIIFDNLLCNITCFKCPFSIFKLNINMFHHVIYNMTQYKFYWTVDSSPESFFKLVSRIGGLIKDVILYSSNKNCNQCRYDQISKREIKSLSLWFFVSCATAPWTAPQLQSLDAHQRQGQKECWHLCLMSNKQRKSDRARFSFRLFTALTSHLHRCTLWLNV